MKLGGFQASDHALSLEMYERQFPISPLPFPKELDAEDELQKWMESRIGNSKFAGEQAMSSLNVVRSALIQQCAMETRIRIVQAVLAIERYRLTNQNRLPEKLADVVPSFLPAVPMDPFDGKPIRYKKLPKGYMVYSVGEDRKDDGGVYTYRPKKGDPLDITFVVEH